MNNKIYNFTPKQRKRDLRFYKLYSNDELPLQFLLKDREWCLMSGSNYWHSLPPAWYKRIKNRKLRAKCKSKLHYQLTHIDDYVSFPLFVKNALYDWF